MPGPYFCIMMYKQNKAGIKKRYAFLVYDLFFLGMVLLILLALVLLVKQ